MFIDFGVTMATIFDVQFFSENEKYLLMKKNYFCYFNYCVCSSY